MVLEFLRKALSVIKSLIALTLNSNSIGDTGAAALSEALESNRTLIYFESDPNNIRESPLIDSIITERLKKNKVLNRTFFEEQNKEDIQSCAPVCAYQNEEEESVVSEDEIRSISNILHQIESLKKDITPDLLASSSAYEKLAYLYNELGDQYKAEGLYKQAIMCYRVLNKSLSIKQCFKDWMESDPENPDILMMRGDHLKSTGQYDKAIAQYRYAIELGGKEIKAEATQKIINILDQKDTLVDHYTQMLSTHSLNCEMLTEEFSSELSGDASGYKFVYSELS